MRFGVRPEGWVRVSLPDAEAGDQPPRQRGARRALRRRRAAALRRLAQGRPSPVPSLRPHDRLARRARRPRAPQGARARPSTPRGSAGWARPSSSTATAPTPAAASWPSQASRSRRSRPSAAASGAEPRVSPAAHTLASSSRGRSAGSPRVARSLPCRPAHEDHLHPHRRGSRARHALPAADRPGVRRRRGRRGRAARHLARRPDPRPVPRLARRPSSGSPTRWPSSASSPRRPRRTSSSCRTSARRCRRSRRRSPSFSRRATRSPTIPADPGRPGAGEVRRGQGLGGQPGPARGQLRPPRARVGQGVRAQAPAPRWARGRRTAKSHVSTMSGGDFRSTEQSVTVAADGRRADRARRRRRHGHGAQGAHAGARGRGARRGRHAPRRARRVPRRAGRRGQGSRACCSRST